MKNVTDRNIKDIFLQHGFKEKPQADGPYNLNPYVFDAARALLEFAARAPVPPAGDVEVLGWALNDGDEHPIDITLQWGVAKHWPEYATPLVDRAHVTRLTAERDGLLVDVKSLTEHRDELKIQRDRWVKMHNNLQSELTKARELLTKGSHYGPHPWNQQVMDFLVHQSAPAAKAGE